MSHHGPSWNPLSAVPLLVALAAVLAAGTSRPALAALDAEMFKVHGGTYLSDCGNPASTKVTVFEDAVVFLEGSRRIAFSNVQAQHSFFGNSPPDGYLVALVSETPGGEQLVCIVFRDDSGEYLKLDGDNAVLARIGKPARDLVYRRCSGAGGKKASAPAAKGPPQPKGPPQIIGVTANAMLLDPGFKAAYRKALGPRVREPWLADLDGPSHETRKVRIGGAEYLLAGACKNHDCADYSVVLLYSTARRAVYGRIHEQGRVTRIGAPGPAIARELDRVWNTEWRSGR